MKFAEQNAHNLLRNKVRKIVQITYRTGEGRKMSTGRFLINVLGNENVWVHNTAWDESGNELKSVGKQLAISLEKVHFVMYGEIGVWPKKR